jgi:hypothetical protein
MFTCYYCSHAPLSCVLPRLRYNASADDADTTTNNARAHGASIATALLTVPLTTRRQYVMMPMRQLGMIAHLSPRVRPTRLHVREQVSREHIPPLFHTASMAHSPALFPIFVFMSIFTWPTLLCLFAAFFIVSRPHGPNGLLFEAFVAT